jgi:hypothetical protein
MPVETPEIRLGLHENLPQFTLLAVVNAFVGAMVGMERSILPAIAEHEFALSATSAILAFIAVCGCWFTAIITAINGCEQNGIFGTNAVGKSRKHKESA